MGWYIYVRRRLALLSGEMATVLSVLQAVLASTEHQEFMQNVE
ncbi:hypothetical protein QUB80_18035 [Chlorogloeopsis sp. ULAP01]|nr:hypothetical protein [Chlorogloeopsis sp. ULAP01]MDM9382601.1 hypothetical protein [Chlorogloeopsis sp. ULAP01]